MITALPGLIQEGLQGVVGKAIDKGLIQIDVINPRIFAVDVHQTIDDRPFGGGDGMLLKTEPIALALDQAQQKQLGKKRRVVHLTPQGKLFDQKAAERLSQYEEITLLCGRYAGIDERAILNQVDEELSIGDYVLSGGELAALVVVDAVARLLPGVLGHQDSAQKDSLQGGLLESPQFTRPAEWKGLVVPEVLTSGHHARILKFHEKVSQLITIKKRPDLLAAEDLTASQKEELQSFWSELSLADKQVLGLNENPLLPLKSGLETQLHLALVHYPMLDREGACVATNITNFDIHDIARASRVYGVRSYTLVHPMQEQLMFVHRILDHWKVGTGARYNPSRKRALENVTTATSIEELKTKLSPDMVILTHARRVAGVKEWTTQELRSQIAGGKKVLVLFGTGYGFPEDLLRAHDGILESLKGPPPDDFRHLSVRSAVSIYLDRLCSPC